MFPTFNSETIKTLNKNYEKKLEEAILAQRNGDNKNYSLLTFEAERIYQNLIAIKK